MNDHVVVDAKEQKLRCNRCGATAPLYLPDSVTLFVARARAFEQMHCGCQEQDKRPSEPKPSTAFLSPEAHRWLQDHISDQDVYTIVPRWVWDAVISQHVHSNLYIDRNDRFKRGLGGVIWKQCELCLDPKDRPAWQRVWFSNEKTMKDWE